MVCEPDEALDELAHEVIGAAIEVHRELGAGFLETVYEAALCSEFELRHIRYVSQFPVNVLYKGRYVGESRLDLLVENGLVVELKAVEVLHPVFTAQVISYLKAMQLPLGLLINFNVPVLKQGIRRIVWSDRAPHPRPWESKN
jgi:GxxExxY protein